jgi:hypothetical protein
MMEHLRQQYDVVMQMPSSRRRRFVMQKYEALKKQQADQASAAASMRSRSRAKR